MNLHVFACLENAVSCVKLLLETTPTIMNWQDYDGRTPLHLAVEIGNYSVVTLLVSVWRRGPQAVYILFTHYTVYHIAQCTA